MAEGVSRGQDCERYSDILGYEPGLRCICGRMAGGMRPARLPLHLRRLEAEAIEVLREGAAEFRNPVMLYSCLLYTSDAADDLLCVDLGGRRIIKKKKQTNEKINI